MAGSCCNRPIAKIIKVGNFEAGIIGLEEAFQNVYRSGLTDPEQIKSDLLRMVKEYGNYMTPAAESQYKEALLGEYKKFLARRI